VGHMMAWAGCYSVVVEEIHLVFGEDELMHSVGLAGIRWLHALLPPRLLWSSSVDFPALSVIKCEFPRRMILCNCVFAVSI
jgi:hypothetical protein